MEKQVEGDTAIQNIGSTVEEAPTENATLAAEKSEATKRVPVRPWHLFRFAGPAELVAVFIGVVFSFLMGGAMPLFAVFFGDATSASFAPSGKSALETMGPTLVNLALLAIGQFVGGFVWQAALVWAAERQAAAMRKEYLRAALAQDTAWFDVSEPAGLPSRMALEVGAISHALGAQLGMLIMGLGQFFFGLVVAYIKGWKLSLLMSSTLPFMAITGYLFSKSMAVVTSDQHAWFAKAGAVAEEVVMAIRTVAAFGGEQHEIERFGSHLKEAKRGGVMAGIHMGLSLGFMFSLMSALYAVGFWYGAYHMIADGIDPAEFMTVFFAIFIGVSSLQQLADPVLSWAKAIASASSMFALLQTVPQIEQTSTLQEPATAEVAVVDRIDFNGVHFSYACRPEVTVLRGLTLTIHRGQKVALVGESGSGKSTIIQLLERFYDPCAGEVLINGVNLRQVPLLSWRRLIGYVGQEPVLFATSALDNIKGGDLSISDEQAHEAAKQAQALDFLLALPEKLDSFVGSGGGQLSGGQKQRVAIARALVKRPQVLLLDEATSALDNESEKMVQETIDALQTSGTSGGTQLTTISIAHRLSTVRNAGVIFVLKQGVLCEQGSHQELMESEGEYFCLVQSQDTQEDSTNEQQPSLPAETSKLSDSRVSDSSSKEKAASGPVDQPCTEKEKEEALLKEMKDAGFKTPTGRLFALMKPQWPILVVALLAALVAGATMPVSGRAFSGAMNAMYIPLMPGGTVDAMLDDMDTWVLLFGILAVASLVGELGKYSVFNYIQECLILRLRRMAFGSLLCQEIGFFDNPRNGPAGLVSMLAKHTSVVAQATGIGLGNALGAVLAIFVGLALAFEGSWRLTLAVLGAVPIVGISMAVVMKMMMMSGGDESNGAYHASYEAATEAIVNIRTVRALVSEQHSADLFSRSVDVVAKKESGSAWKKGLAFGFGNGAMFSIYIVAFWYGSYLIDDGLEPDRMFQSLFCILFGVMGAGMAAMFSVTGAAGQVAAYETFRTIDRESQIDAVTPAGQHRELGDGSIALEDVRFFYPHRPGLVVLQSLSLTIPLGSSAGFVGPSGCGKSTVIQLVQRFYDPTSGEVKVGGVALREFDVAWWRRQLGFVGQEPVLFDVSLEDNVRYGRQGASQEEVVAAAKTANMEYVGDGKITWGHRVGSRGGQLSGGQKQRCAIARALIRDPKYLILDEATSALDSASEHLVQAALDAARQGRTTLSIAHRLSTIKDSDVIFVLKGGQVAEGGSHGELIEAKGAYWHLTKRGAE